MKNLFQILLFLFMATPEGYSQILFHESFDDTALSARGWYDNPRIMISGKEHIPGSKGSAVFHWKKGDTAPESGGTSRRQFTPTDSVYIDFWIKYSANYTGSDHPYHPHEFYLLTTENDSFTGPAFTYLTAYIEQNEGIPQLALQDGMNIDLTKVKTDLNGVTEDRAVCGCNGMRPEEEAFLVDCYKAGSGYWNGKIWQAKQKYFQNTEGRFNQNEWHHITAFFKLNTIENGKGLPNGIVRYWYDGSLIIDNARVILRTAKHPDMKFNQFLIGPWIGDGSPVDQAFWVDELTLSTHPLTFPAQMVSFKPGANNPVFTGTDTLTWDRKIRERGFILYEEGKYKMWYTGYAGGDNDPKSLGYAESTDGIQWLRHPDNPIYKERWTEDVFVMHVDSVYYMFAEGTNDIAHLLTSADGLKWTDQGDLIILNTKGDTLPGPYGTPSAILENGTWYLFYERNDEAVWIATTTDMITWKNLQDAPVLEKGPDDYDAGAVATNQVIRFGDQYYMFYHGSSDPDWSRPGATSLWTTSVAASKDLMHWIKYPGNPIVEGDHSSGILVWQNGAYKLFTMHDIVWMYNPE